MWYGANLNCNSVQKFSHDLSPVIPFHPSHPPTDLPLLPLYTLSRAYSSLPHASFITHCYCHHLFFLIHFSFSFLHFLSSSHCLTLPSLPFFCRPMSLSLENPDDCDVDIGRNSFQMQKIRRAFEHGQQVPNHPANPA